MVFIVMNVRFYIDPETKQPHIYYHDVDEEEVEYVLLNPGEDRAGVEDSRSTIGKTQTGRYLRVVYVPDPLPNSVFVITAYELKGKPLTAYRRRQRRQGKRK
jgi:hypothetical protein